MTGDALREVVRMATTLRDRYLANLGDPTSTFVRCITPGSTGRSQCRAAGGVPAAWIALDDALSALAAADAAPAVEREAGERDLPDGEFFGARFGMGAVAVSTGRYAGEPAVILREPSAAGAVGEPVEGGTECGPIRAVLTFPTKAQALAVQHALVTPPAEAREPSAG